ncbi:MFS family permease [Chryseobacterium rhizosphaerae]|uniref:MFS family permease n=1 Tax=Chryseobacterium rhizosphaerae TaxID=395937 RepID=A0AAE3YDK3_9FLAO|nr:MFS transporter [Chryseobacterium rhizosphaerae]MDR6528216.1 MFS family permease [Chryseobacterium rhizosphaerae]
MKGTNNRSTAIENTSWYALLSNGNGIKAVTLALGVMLHATNVYLATTVMPSIIKEIGGLEYYAWNTTLFVVASVIGSVISANRISKLGPRKSYQLAILVFSVGTLVCSLASSMPILLLGRFIQGLGGGLLFALSYAMIRIVFSENLWPRAMALISGMWGIAAFSGPFIGGIFAEQNEWRWAFGVLLIICMVILIISSLILPNTKSAKEIPSIPFLKLLMLVLASFSVSAGSIFENSSVNIAGVVLALFFLYMVKIRENKNTEVRLLPSGSYSLSSSLGKVYAVMSLLTIATSIEIFVPYFAQVLNGFSPIQSGYLTVLIAIGWTLSSILFSGVKADFSNKLILSGCTLMLIGLSGLTIISFPMDITSTSTKLVLTCIFLFAIGMGIGAGWPHLLTKVFSLAPKGEEELTSTSVTTVQLIATAFGAALAGLVSNIGGITNPGGFEGTQNASLVLYGTFSLAPLLAMIIIVFRNKK